jgi:hypothetical protein
VAGFGGGICRVAIFEFTSPHDEEEDEDHKNQHDGSRSYIHGRLAFDVRSRSLVPSPIEWVVVHWR